MPPLGFARRCALPTAGDAPVALLAVSLAAWLAAWLTASLTALEGPAYLQMMKLKETWALRNTLASALEQVLDDLEAGLGAAPAEELVALIDSFLPGRSPSPEWSSSVERLVELMWTCVPSETMAELRTVYAEREGPQWEPLVHKFSTEHGERLEQRRWRPADARRPAVILR